ncbi:MAG: hypothetical protein H0X51_04315 [Parachlamydiaceae bacterium]|nr:hypothetical protein [Parachlamydiaceae bacterium]
MSLMIPSNSVIVAVGSNTEPLLPAAEAPNFSAVEGYEASIKVKLFAAVVFGVSAYLTYEGSSNPRSIIGAVCGGIAISFVVWTIVDGFFLVQEKNALEKARDAFNSGPQYRLRLERKAKTVQSLVDVPVD